MTDLTQHLKEGMQVYSALHGSYGKVKTINNSVPYCIRVNYKDYPGASFTEHGAYLVGGECMLFRDKDKTPWEKEKSVTLITKCD